MAAVAVSTSCIFCRPSQLNVTSRPPLTLNLDQRRGEIRNAASSYLETFISEYVRDFSPHSCEMRKNINYYGGEEVGRAKVAEGYVALYGACLDVALQRTGEEVSNTDIIELSERLVGIHAAMAKETDLNLANPAAKEAYVIWGEQKVKHFRRVVEANLTSDEANYLAMTRRAYTKADFAAMLKEQNDAEKVLFGGFKESLKDELLLKLFGPAVIDAQQRESWKLNSREIDRFYPNGE